MKKYIGIEWWTDKDDNEYELEVMWEHNVDKDCGVDEWRLVSVDVADGSQGMSNLEWAMMVDTLTDCGPDVKNLEEYDDRYY